MQTIDCITIRNERMCQFFEKLKQKQRLNIWYREWYIDWLSETFVTFSFSFLGVFPPSKTHIFSKLWFRSKKVSVSWHSMAVNISVVRVQHGIQYWLWKEKVVSPDFFSRFFFCLRYFTLSRVNVWNQLKAETFQSGLTFSFWHRP